MRDIIPSRDRSSPVRTPWTTYTDVTPKVSTLQKTRAPRSTSTRKNRPPRDVSSPSSDELPNHEARQLPRRISSRRNTNPEPRRSPIDVIEEFIRDLAPEDKEAVRATYNGPDWPKSNRMKKRTFVPPIVIQPDPIYLQQPIAFVHHAPASPPPVHPIYYPQSMTCLDLSQRYSPQPHFLSPPMTPTPNRFLAYINAQGTNFFQPRGS